MEETNIVCWVCSQPLTAHTDTERIECEKAPLASEAIVIHTHPSQMESRIVARVMALLGQLRPVDK
jgi:hypothetical protein